MGNFPSTSPPPITEKNIPDQADRVWLITGSTSGIGLELAQILYTANARVWIVGRSRSKGEQTIKDIKAAAPKSSGSLELLIVDFNDLRTIRPSIEDFLRRETRLHVLCNNAGIMIPPQGTVTEQSYEAQLGVNGLAPFLFTKLLVDVLSATASNSTPGTTRVLWISSSAASRFSPKGGVDLSLLQPSNGLSQWQNYGMSKAAGILLASEFAQRYHGTGVLCAAVDPGNLDTNLYRDMPAVQRKIVKFLALKPPIHGAYTELFAALSNDISDQNSGAWVTPWGTISNPREDIASSQKSEANGGTGVASRFWDWCGEQTSAFS